MLGSALALQADTAHVRADLHVERHRIDAQLAEKTVRAAADQQRNPRLSERAAVGGNMIAP